MKPLLELPLLLELLLLDEDATVPLLLPLLAVEVPLAPPLLLPDAAVEPEDPEEVEEPADAPLLEAVAITQVPSARHSPDAQSTPLRHSGVPPGQAVAKLIAQRRPRRFVAVHKTAR